MPWGNFYTQCFAACGMACHFDGAGQPTLDGADRDLRKRLSYRSQLEAQNWFAPSVDMLGRMSSLAMRTKKDITKNLVPPLKWVGGKRWLLHRGTTIFPEVFNRYFEPFLGSGAVFFRLNPSAGLISDINSELVELYSAIKERPDLVQRNLAKHSLQHSKEYYYRTRAKIPNTAFSRAARMLYLNRTCWNGLYRVNQRGEFNVPIGTKTAVLASTDDFGAISAALKDIDIAFCDFGEAIGRARENDFVFCDPPYTVKHNNNGFVKYNESIFSWADQERLAKSVKRASQRGVKVLITNAYHDSILELYKGFFIQKLDRASVISGVAHGRGRYEECLIKNY